MSSYFRYFLGTSALSDFRQKRLQYKLHQLDACITSVIANYFYLVQFNHELDDKKSKLFLDLLQANEISDVDKMNGFQYNVSSKIDKRNKIDFIKKIFVVPREGTISPWSSKAIDILTRSVSDQIIRIERGICYKLGYVRYQKKSFLNNAYVFHDQNMMLNKSTSSEVYEMLYDRLTESISETIPNINIFFSSHIQSLDQEIDISSQGKSALSIANKKFGLALSDDEIDYLYNIYKKSRRNLTDAELTMFAQANSEHCRHKIFNSSWIIDGLQQEHTLFEMIRCTHKSSPSGTILAYEDNAAILVGHNIDVLLCNQERFYTLQPRLMHLVIKVETHNHPTAISPFSGAATGVGGEIRDEGATGCGAYSKAGISGYICSNLYLSNLYETWEYGYDAMEYPCADVIEQALFQANHNNSQSSHNNSQSSHQYDPIGLPLNIATPYKIMEEAPLGAASFSNEFGRPMLLGFFRVYEQKLGTTWFGFHKPLMLAGGIGNIEASQAFKKKLSKNVFIIQIGGPGMRIGLGGGTASSLVTGMNTIENDFSSVQRANPEMQRRAQQVIDSCWQLGETNPILSIHDVGAGGLSNACPELLETSKVGGNFYLSKIPVDELGMSSCEIWSNEAQERYVLAILDKDIDILARICKRERCPYSIIGETKLDRFLTAKASTNNCIYDEHPVIDMSMDILFNKALQNIKRTKKYQVDKPLPKINLSTFSLKHLGNLIHAVLRHPAVGSKAFLINIADRTVGGLTVRDQCVGPWQIPTADCAITAMSFNSDAGEAIAIGERAPIAVVSSSASVRMAIGEAITNIAAATISSLSAIKLSANWMAGCNKTGQDISLFEAVQAATELCKKLNLSIPVGKDSLSMQTNWQKKYSKFRRPNHAYQDNYDTNTSILEVISPVTLTTTAFAAIDNIRSHMTPQCVPLSEIDNSSLILIDLGAGKNRLGASIFSQTICQVGSDVPDLDDAKDLENFFHAIQMLQAQKLIHAYHDRSDGGLIATVAEMTFTSKVGIVIELDTLFSNYCRTKNILLQQKTSKIDFVLHQLFSEELGAVVQINHKDYEKVFRILKNFNLDNKSYFIGFIQKEYDLKIFLEDKKLYQESIINLQRSWTTVSWQIARNRDNQSCADDEYQNIEDIHNNPGISIFLPDILKNNFYTSKIPSNFLPRVAILREQGSNSHKEMAFAFLSSNFTVVDVHMTDIAFGQETLDNFVGIVFVGGFSFGDVFGAGRGWANSILNNTKLYDIFSRFFSRQDTFALGVCNGCQVMAHLTSIIPGTEYWPTFTRNISEQFEARLSMIEISKNPSWFLSEMTGARLPIVSSHGEGFANFSKQGNINLVSEVMYYINNKGERTERYPFNPNGSPRGIAALTTNDGRFTIMMPHPERTLRCTTTSYYPKTYEKNQSKFTPWIEMFRSVRRKYS